MHYVIYKTTNNVNGKIYIGCHRTKNMEDSYLGSGKLLKRAIKKYGRENFTKEILEEYDNVEEMINMELMIVNEEFIKDDNNYNLMTGGYGGWKIVNEKLTPKLRSQNRINFQLDKCRKYTPEELTIKKRENGRKLFLEQRGIFDPKYKNIGTDAARGIKNNGFAGKQHSTSAKRKIGEANSKFQKGEYNSQYGTCWIYSLNEKKNKKINKYDLEQYLDDGWIKGRKMNFN